MKQPRSDANRDGVCCFQAREYSNAHHDLTSYGSTRKGIP